MDYQAPGIRFSLDATQTALSIPMTPDTKTRKSPLGWTLELAGLNGSQTEQVVIAIQAQAVEDYQSQLTRAHAVLKQAREAIVEFGQHKPLCEHDDLESPMCTCGYLKSLHAIDELLKP